MNILQILTITTIGYFAFVALWVTRMEDFLMTREERRKETSYDGATPDTDSDSGSGNDPGGNR